jgi:hypothetical protein
LHEHSEGSSSKRIFGRFKTLGILTLAAEATNVSEHCLRLLLDDEELAVPFSDFPWFKSATIEQLSGVERLTENRLYWPALDVDLSAESIRTPGSFSLVAKDRGCLV